ncbi:MAG: GFA family protein [Gammaproteobacteria bacterium]
MHTHKLSGGCLCGAVRYAITRPSTAVMCHCKQCRKAQGAGFACNMPVPRAAVVIDDSSGALKSYRSSDTKVRAFCGLCGSPIYSARDNNDDLRIRVGTLDNSADIEVRAHIFAPEAASWSPITDSLPTYETFEPGRQ